MTWGRVHSALRIRRLFVPSVLWLLAFVGYVAVLKVRHHVEGALSCELVAGSSYYGEARWSWLPPGTTCTYTVGANDDLTFTTGPAPWAYVRPTLLAFWAVSIGRPVLVRDGHAGSHSPR